MTHEVGLTDLLASFDNSHPVGLQALLTMFVSRLFGVNFLILNVLSFITLISSAILLFLTLRRSFNDGVAGFVVAPLMLLMLFHPSQMEHLLWPFEIGWFLVDFSSFSMPC